MFKQISTYFSTVKQRKIKRTIVELAHSSNAFILDVNKELTELEKFYFLLGLFKSVSLEGANLSQNINRDIICFSETIYKLCETMSKIRKGVDRPTKYTAREIRSLPRLKLNSYIFFNSNDSDNVNTFDQKSLNQLVEWMQYILDYYEYNKASTEIVTEDICHSLYSKMEVFYETYYFLLCHLSNLPCDVNTNIVRYNTDEY